MKVNSAFGQGNLDVSWSHLQGDTDEGSNIGGSFSMLGLQLIGGTVLWSYYWANYRYSTVHCKY